MNKPVVSSQNKTKDQLILDTPAPPAFAGDTDQSDLSDLSDILDTPSQILDTPFPVFVFPAPSRNP